MESDIQRSFNLLKEKLSSIGNILFDCQDQNELKSEETKIKYSYQERSNEEKLKELELINYGDDKIVFDACGKEYITSKTTITNCLIDNVLKERLNVDKIYLDIPKMHFKYIITILRFFNKYEFNGEKLILNMKANDDADNLETVMKEIFTDFTLIDEYVILK